MKYKRLTRRLTDGRIEYIYSDTHHLFQRLAELEDRIENGTLIELPCKVGDTVYFETYMGGIDVGIHGHEVVGFKIDALVKRDGAIIATEVPITKFGNDVFLTKEEAESNLRGEKNDKN